ncbi:MAG: hypothetical protein J6A29_02745, partial [Clostridia bacterium]|nr:hypothetical protein [Clostridia bacterium]
MFSSIISLFKNITKAKYKKEKKETKKKIKQEEIKILKQLKNKLAGLANAKAKEAESVKDSKKKEKKLKAQVFLLNLLQAFIEFLEFTFGSIITIVILLLLCIALVFIIVWIALNGLLHIDMSLGNGSIFNGSKEEECIQGSQVIENTNFDLGSVGQLSGTLTGQQQNIYRCLGVYQEIINGDLGYSAWKDKFPDVVNKIGASGISKFLLGFMATETGLSFSNGDKNCLEYVTHPTYTDTSAGHFGFLGLNINTKLDTHAPEIADAIRNKYKPKDTYKYESDFAPYAIAIQSTITATGDYPHYGKSYDWVKSNESKVEEIMNAYSIPEGEKDELKFKITLMGTSTYYHGGGLNEGLVSLWTALWSATGGFDNIEITSSSYEESTYRTRILGVGGKNNCTAKWGQAVTPIFKIKGQEVTVILWDWVWKNCTNPDYFKNTAKVWLDSKAEYAGNGVILNGHYGLIAYLMGNKVVQDL